MQNRLVAMHFKPRFISSSELAEARNYIDSIDFSMIIEKMVREDAWLRQDVLATCQLYRNFLFLHKKYDLTSFFVPSIEVDQFWHNHILDTEKYHADCQAIFGKILSHYPYLILDGKMTKKDLIVAFDQMQQLHLQEFGTYIYATRTRLPKKMIRLWNYFVGE